MLKNLTSLPSKIGQVFEVKSFDSYVKRPTGTVITVEVADVSKLPGCILLPPLDLKEAIDATMTQRILYLGLLNQCRRCRKFGHYARRCLMPRAWDGKSPEFSRPQIWSKRVSFSGKFPDPKSGKEDMLNSIKDQMAKMTEAWSSAVTKETNGVPQFQINFPNTISMGPMRKSTGPLTIGLLDGEDCVIKVQWADDMSPTTRDSQLHSFHILGITRKSC
jgi:hypothetical protein